LRLLTKDIDLDNHVADAVNLIKRESLREGLPCGVVLCSFAGCAHSKVSAFASPRSNDIRAGNSLPPS
jgi:hypothetical protein